MLRWNTLQISPDCIWRLAALTGESLIFAWTLAGLVHILIWGKGAISSTAKSRSNNSWPCKAQKLTGEHARRNTFAAQGAASLEQLEVAGSDRTDDQIKQMATYLFHRVSEIEALLSWQNSIYFDKFELQHHTGLSKVIKSVCIYTSLEGFWKAILKCNQCSNIFLKGVHQVSIMAMSFMSAMSAGRTWLSFWMRPCLLCSAPWHSATWKLWISHLGRQWVRTKIHFDSNNFVSNFWSFFWQVFGSVGSVASAMRAMRDMRYTPCACFGA